ncbi:MAG: hypothetical protein IKA58_02400 [Clostridia bacterium]|nr:hypothetical protein [Clostridia bacterium]MBR6654953.1 hypothetical protein [Oscillospiraceae bacterium]
MTPENQKKYDEKVARVQAAIALKEPDRVPITPSTDAFPIINAGFTVGEVIYDTSLQKMKQAVVKYLNDFDPDKTGGVGMVFAGEGPMLELERSKNMRWAGMPGDIIDINSIQQHIEFPTLLDDEFEEFFSDRTGWSLRKQTPRTSGLLEPFAKLRLGGMMGARMLAAQVSTPEFKAMLEDLWKLNELQQVYQAGVKDVNETVREMGYPDFSGGMAAVPFDSYSDGLRGTILSLQDLYDHEDEVEKYIEETFEQQLHMIRMQGANPANKGKHVFMALHKGMDGFMSDEHYRHFYWRHLQKIIETIIEVDMVPYIFTEGKYNSRLDCLTEVPVGKVFYHFETVDMALAKSKLKDIACISGGFSTNILQFGKPEQVKDEVKRLLDICAPGGGFIFETSSALSHVKRENVEAMFETVKEYGKY